MSDKSKSGPHEDYDAEGATLAQLEEIAKKSKERAIKSVTELVEWFRGVVKDDPEDHETYEILAANLAYLRDYSGAVEAVREALRLDPENESYRAKLAKYEAALKQQQSD